MAIQLLKYTTIKGGKMEMKGGAPNSLGVELLFLSCTAKERKTLLHDLTAKHDELMAKDR